MAVAAVASVLVEATGACSFAARPPHPLPPATSRFVFEQVTRDRWLQPAQRPEFTPFSDASSTLYLTFPTSYSRGGERTIHVAMRSPMMGDSAVLRVRRDGSIVRQDAWLRPIASMSGLLPEDSAQMARFRLLAGRHLLLPLARTWDVVPTVHPRRFRAGERWTDTIALATELDGSRQALNGRRTSVLIGDTVVAGRRVSMVRDSADVRYTEHELQQERTLNALVVVDRTATGTVRSRYLVRPRARTVLGPRRHDMLAGEAVLRYPDGRSFRTPARYERTRLWTLFDPQAYATRQADQRADAQRRWSGPVRVPIDESQRRLSSGDVLLRDSLMTAWEREADPNRREERYRILQQWAPGGRAFRNQLVARRIATGDSAFAIEQLANRAYPARPPIERDEAEQMIRVMRDPGIAFALGASRDALYENLVQTFVTSPRALRPIRLGGIVCRRHADCSKSNGESARNPDFATWAWRLSKRRSRSMGRLGDCSRSCWLACHRVCGATRGGRWRDVASRGETPTPRSKRGLARMARMDEQPGARLSPAVVPAGAGPRAVRGQPHQRDPILRGPFRSRRRWRAPTPARGGNR